MSHVERDIRDLTACRNEAAKLFSTRDQPAALQANDPIAERERYVAFAGATGSGKSMTIQSLAAQSRVHPLNYRPQYAFNGDVLPLESFRTFGNETKMDCSPPALDELREKLQDLTDAGGPDFPGLTAALDEVTAGQWLPWLEEGGQAKLLGEVRAAMTTLHGNQEANGVGGKLKKLRKCLEGARVHVVPEAFANQVRESIVLNGGKSRFDKLMERVANFVTKNGDVGGFQNFHLFLPSSESGEPTTFVKTNVRYGKIPQLALSIRPKKKLVTSMKHGLKGLTPAVQDEEESREEFDARRKQEKENLEHTLKQMFCLYDFSNQETRSLLLKPNTEVPNNATKLRAAMLKPNAAELLKDAKLHPVVERLAGQTLIFSGRGHNLEADCEFTLTTMLRLLAMFRTANKNTTQEKSLQNMLVSCEETGTEVLRQWPYLSGQNLGLRELLKQPPTGGEEAMEDAAELDAMEASMFRVLFALSSTDLYLPCDALRFVTLVDCPGCEDIDQIKQQEMRDAIQNADYLVAILRKANSDKELIDVLLAEWCKRLIPGPNQSNFGACHLVLLSCREKASHDSSLMRFVDTSARDDAHELIISDAKARIVEKLQDQEVPQDAINTIMQQCVTATPLNLTLCTSIAFGLHGSAAEKEVLAAEIGKLPDRPAVDDFAKHVLKSGGLPCLIGMLELLGRRARLAAATQCLESLQNAMPAGLQQHAQRQRQLRDRLDGVTAGMSARQEEVWEQMAENLVKYRVDIGDILGQRLSGDRKTVLQNYATFSVALTQQVGSSAPFLSGIDRIVDEAFDGEHGKVSAFFKDKGDAAQKKWNAFRNEGRRGRKRLIPRNAKLDPETGGQYTTPSFKVMTLGSVLEDLSRATRNDDGDWVGSELWGAVHGVAERVKQEVLEPFGKQVMENHKEALKGVAEHLVSQMKPDRNAASQAVYGRLEKLKDAGGKDLGLLTCVYQPIAEQLLQQHLMERDGADLLLANAGSARKIQPKWLKDMVNDSSAISDLFTEYADIPDEPQAIRDAMDRFHADMDAGGVRKLVCDGLKKELKELLKEELRDRFRRVFEKLDRRNRTPKKESLTSSLYFRFIDAVAATLAGHEEDDLFLCRQLEYSKQAKLKKKVRKLVNRFSRWQAPTEDEEEQAVSDGSSAAVEPAAALTLAQLFAADTDSQVRVEAAHRIGLASLLFWAKRRAAVLAAPPPSISNGVTSPPLRAASTGSAQVTPSRPVAPKPSQVVPAVARPVPEPSVHGAHRSTCRVERFLYKLLRVPAGETLHKEADIPSLADCLKTGGWDSQERIVELCGMVEYEYRDTATQMGLPRKLYNALRTAVLDYCSAQTSKKRARDGASAQDDDDHPAHKPYNGAGHDDSEDPFGDIDMS